MDKSPRPNRKPPDPFLGGNKTHGKLERATLLSEQDGPILITGDSGTGKTRLARELHNRSPRKSGPCLDLGCGELHKESVESTLFGHNRGAFTGAIADRQGLFEQAHRGTLILNDIDRLSLECQGKLLRFLDDGLFSRLGETVANRSADVRIVVTSNKNLKALAGEEKFLSDLHSRLKYWCIHLAPLRERPEDIRILSTYFLNSWRKRKSNATTLWSFSRETIQLFQHMVWPDNIRGLRSAVEHIALFAEGERDCIEVKQAIDVLLDPDNDFADHLPKCKPGDTKYLKVILDLTAWNIKLTGRITGFSRTTIYRRIEEEGWQKPM